MNHTAFLLAFQSETLQQSSREVFYIKEQQKRTIPVESYADWFPHVTNLIVSQATWQQMHNHGLNLSLGRTFKDIYMMPEAKLNE